MWHLKDIKLASIISAPQYIVVNLVARTFPIMFFYGSIVACSDLFMKYSLRYHNTTFLCLPLIVRYFLLAWFLC